MGISFATKVLCQPKTTKRTVLLSFFDYILLKDPSMYTTHTEMEKEHRTTIYTSDTIIREKLKVENWETTEKILSLGDLYISPPLRAPEKETEACVCALCHS
jgi:hypothetical protein